MNGILFDIKRFEIHDGPGIRTTVFMKGCPLKCVWCHNPEGIRAEPERIKTVQRVEDQVFEQQVFCGRSWSAEELTDEILRDKPFFDESGGGVTFSGGEPVLQAEFLLQVLELCGNHSVHTCLDTCGYCSSGILERLIPRVNLFLYDLKIMDSVSHEVFTGVGNERILKNLESLHRSGAGVILRFPLIPGINDAEKNIHQMLDFLRPMIRFRRIDILPYHRYGESKYRRMDQACVLSIPEDQAVERAADVKQMFDDEGFEVRIGG